MSKVFEKDPKMVNEFDYYLIDSICFGDAPWFVNDDEFDSFGIGVLSQNRVMSSNFAGHITPARRRAAGTLGASGSDNAVK